ncbi:hypothetical protein [Pseudomonas monteilii]|uniref:hypothetical protein n=1 Tax=Pseudomonas monteilii TaxID=76759 RepID=UPI003F6DD43D
MQHAQAQERHEVLFTMSAQSMQRTTALLKRCGHQNLNLLLARGLALVEFVLDQLEQGRSVGSVILGEDGFLPLRERPELVTPREGARPKAVPAPTRGGTTHTDNPKLMPRAKVPVEATVQEQAPRVRKLFRHAAFNVNDLTGPVRSVEFHTKRCASEGLEAPIDYTGQALPGELGPHHLEELERVMGEESMATHFQLCPSTYALTFFAFFPKGGWHRMQSASREWLHDLAVDTGEVSVFSVDLAAAYLRWQGSGSQGRRQVIEA